MILSVCFSPCFDVNIELRSLAIGKKNTTISKKVFCTGKALNVAKGLAKFNTPCMAVGFMYEENGQLFEQDLKNQNVPYEFVWCKGRVRENYKLIDDRSMLTEIDDVSPAVGEEKAEELIRLIKKLSLTANAIVLAGSLPRGIDNNFYGSILNQIPANVIRIIDSEGERLLSALRAGGADLVKPNLEELSRTLNVNISNKNEAISACNKLIALGAKRVLLSMGKEGAIICNGKQNFYAKSINVAMNSTVGAGDAMVAAATNALVQGADDREILRCGVAAGTATVTQPDSITFRLEKYKDIYAGLYVEEIFV